MSDLKELRSSVTGDLENLDIAAINRGKLANCSAVDFMASNRLPHSNMYIYINQFSSNFLRVHLLSILQSELNGS